jgi:hypothetical protein
LEALEDRMCPAQMAAPVWNPPNANNLLFSNPGNWVGNAVPGTNDTAVFAGNVNQNSCILDLNRTVQGLTFQNGYSGSLVIGNPNTGQAFALTVTGGSDLTNFNQQNQTYVTANLDFIALGSRLYLSGTNNFRNFDCFGLEGQVQLQSGSLNIQTPFGGTATTTADFLIGGTISFQNATSFQFDNGAGLTIAQGGVASSNGMSNTILDDDGGFGGIFENWGTINCTAGAGVGTTISMALLNHGTMNLSGNNGGFLRFASTNAVPGDNFGFVMDQGIINASQRLRLALGASGYHQTGGTLSVTDNTTLFLDTGRVGTTIDGGVIQFTSGTGYGSISFNGTVTWNGGTLNMRVDGSNGANRDFIGGGQFNIAAGANGPTLNVTVQGQRQQGQIWGLITGTGISNRFPHENLNGLQSNIANGTSYQVSS